MPDEKLAEIPYIKFPEGSKEHEYLKARRRELGGDRPRRRRRSESLVVPPLAAFDRLLRSTEDREISTTMALVQVLQLLMRDKNIGKRVVPIVPDEGRTFGMEGLYRQAGIWSHVGQLYTPEDADQLAFYREAKDGQVIQEGITEAGAMAEWMAAASAYSVHNCPLIPFFVFYSMFGFQRIGDLAWAAGDMRCRGFLVGGTSGRTTLNGEGLQHEDGQSHLFASVIPNCRSYDPTFAYEVAVIVQDGLRRMFAEQEDCYYYLTTLNENYAHPAMPEGAAPGILRGMYLFKAGARPDAKVPRVQLLGSGAILREVIAAADLLKNHWGVESDLWSCPSFTELARDGMAVARANLLDPAAPPRRSYVETCLSETRGPAVAATDYVRAYAEQNPALRAAPLRGARHRRLRPLRHPREAAPLLRGRPAPRHGGGAARAGPGRRPARRQGGGGHRPLRHRPEPARSVDGLTREPP